MLIKILALLLFLANAIKVFRAKNKGDMQNAIFYLIICMMILDVLTAI